MSHCAILPGSFFSRYLRARALFLTPWHSDYAKTNDDLFLVTKDAVILKPTPIKCNAGEPRASFEDAKPPDIGVCNDRQSH